jgi:hypothetical protein
MSPHAVNNFVSDLVLMAQAMERLPQVEAELHRAQSEVTEWKSRYDLLALDLEQSRIYAGTLEQKVHQLEVDRDDAELRFLEADERTSRALDFIKATFGNAGTLIQALEPVRPQPEPMPEPKPAEQAVQWVDRTEDYIPKVSEVKPTEQTVGEADKPWQMDHTQGQSETDPTSNTTAATVDLASSAHHTQENVSMPSTTEPAPGTYVGLRYIDVPGYISRSDWLLGGGTNEDYDWRKGNPSSVA